MTDDFFFIPSRVEGFARTGVFIITGWVVVAVGVTTATGTITGV